MASFTLAACLYLGSQSRYGFLVGFGFGSDSIEARAKHVICNAVARQAVSDCCEILGGQGYSVARVTLKAPKIDSVRIK